MNDIKLDGQGMNLDISKISTSREGMTVIIPKGQLGLIKVSPVSPRYQPQGQGINVSIPQISALRAVDECKYPHRSLISSEGRE